MLANLSEAQFLPLKTGDNNALQNVVRNQSSRVCVGSGVEQGLYLWWLLSLLTLIAVVKEKLVMGFHSLLLFCRLLFSFLFSMVCPLGVRLFI